MYEYRIIFANLGIYHMSYIFIKGLCWTCFPLSLVSDLIKTPDEIIIELIYLTQRIIIWTVSLLTYPQFSSQIFYNYCLVFTYSLSYKSFIYLYSKQQTKFLFYLTSNLLLKTNKSKRKTGMLSV